MTYKLRVRQIPREYCSLLAHIIIMFVHTCLFFFLPFIFALVCQSYSSFTLFFHLIHIHMHTHSSLVLTMAYTHARAHIQPTKIHTRHMYIFLIMHASARTHTTCIHTLSCSFFRWIGA